MTPNRCVKLKEFYTTCRVAQLYAARCVRVKPLYAAITPAEIKIV